MVDFINNENCTYILVPIFPLLIGLDKTENMILCTPRLSKTWLFFVQNIICLSPAINSLTNKRFENFSQSGKKRDWSKFIYSIWVLDFWDHDDFSNLERIWKVGKFKKGVKKIKKNRRDFIRDSFKKIICRTKNTRGFALF